MRRIERLAEEIAAEQYRHARRLFVRRGARPPFLLWQPDAPDLPGEALAALWRWWSTRPRTGGLPEAAGIDLTLPRATVGYVSLAELPDSGRKLVHRPLGTAMPDDGRLGPRGHEALFTAALCHAARLRREPIYAAYQPSRDLADQLDVLVLPCAGPHGQVELLVIGSVPDRPYRAFLDGLMDGVVVFDDGGQIHLANRVIAEMLGRPAGQLEQRRIDEVLRAPFLAGGGRYGAALVGAAREAVLCGAAGAKLVVEVSIGTIRHGRGRLFLAVLRDASAHKAIEDHYRTLALTDPLTGLANRVLFYDRLGQATARARRARQGLALLLIDLDDFKTVNDRFGHPVGDLALQEFAQRLRAATREADVLARLGGDEFALVQTDLQQPDGVQALADRLLSALAVPTILNGCDVTLHASIGVAVFPRDGHDADALVARADQALYAAKARGGRCWAHLDQDPD